MTHDRFSRKSNARPLRWHEYRVWRYGESCICRTHESAVRAVALAQRIDPDAHAVNRDGERI